AAVDEITPVDCQVNQFIEIRLVGLSAMRTKDSERRKFSRTARAQIHNSTPNGRKVGGGGISNKKGRQSIGDKESGRQGEKEKRGREIFLITKPAFSPLPFLSPFLLVSSSSFLPATQLGVDRGGSAAVNHQGHRHAEERHGIFKAAGVYEKTGTPMHAED